MVMLHSYEIRENYNIKFRICRPEWFIGHSGSTKKDSEIAEMFSKIEPYLTFLNIPQLERQGELNQSLLLFCFYNRMCLQGIII
jgi:hypothetical protein